MPPKDAPKKKPKKVLKKTSSKGSHKGSRESLRATPPPPPVEEIKQGPPPTKGSCVIINCVEKANHKVLEDTDVIENLWSSLGFAPNVFHNASSKTIHEIIMPNMGDRLRDNRKAPECMIVVLQVEERDGEMTDRNGFVLNLKATFSYLNNAEGLENVPKMIFLHVYNLNNSDVDENGKGKSGGLPSVKNLLQYHYAEHDKSRLGGITMALILSDIFLKNEGPIDVFDSLYKVARRLPRPHTPNYFWQGPVCTSTLFRRLMLEKE